MTKLQKKSLWVLGWLASVAAAFAGGIWAEEHFIIRSQATSIFTQELVVAIDAQRYLENLDRGKPKELREDLITTLNSKIMLLSAFMDYAGSDKDRESAKKFLRRVAEHRRKYPVVYRQIPESVPGAADANAEFKKAHDYVDEILRSYTDEKKQN